MCAGLVVAVTRLFKIRAIIQPQQLSLPLPSDPFLYRFPSVICARTFSTFSPGHARCTCLFHLALAGVHFALCHPPVHPFSVAASFDLTRPHQLIISSSVEIFRVSRRSKVTKYWRLLVLFYFTSSCPCRACAHQWSLCHRSSTPHSNPFNLSLFPPKRSTGQSWNNARGHLHHFVQLLVHALSIVLFYLMKLHSHRPHFSHANCLIRSKISQYFLIIWKKHALR